MSDTKRPRQNPDPAKFYMQVAVGVKMEVRPDAPDIEVPMCRAHHRWPCIDCGTQHFDGCECQYCEKPTPSASNVGGVKRYTLRFWPGHGWVDDGAAPAMFPRTDNVVVLAADYDASQSALAAAEQRVRTLEQRVERLQDQREQWRAAMWYAIDQHERPQDFSPLHNHWSARLRAVLSAKGEAT